jgi:hypothetical protein
MNKSRCLVFLYQPDQQESIPKLLLGTKARTIVPTFGLVTKKYRRPVGQSRPTSGEPADLAGNHAEQEGIL